MQTRLWRGRRFNLVGWLLLGSVLPVWWRWSSLSWHVRGIILAAYGVVFALIMLPSALRTRGLLKTGAGRGHHRRRGAAHEHPKKRRRHLLLPAGAVHHAGGPPGGVHVELWLPRRA